MGSEWNTGHGQAETGGSLGEPGWNFVWKGCQFSEAPMPRTEDKPGALTGPCSVLSARGHLKCLGLWAEGVAGYCFFPRSHGCRGTFQKAAGGGDMLHLP